MLSLRPCTALLGAVCVLSSASIASADAARILKPATRPWFHTLGFGPAISVATCGKGKCTGFREIPGAKIGFTQVMIRNEIMGHFGGKGHGPALGAEIDFGFLQNYFRFTGDLKFIWDIPVVPRYAIYVTPAVGVGISAFSNPGRAAFNTQLGASGTVVLHDRWRLYAQPINLDVNVSDQGATIGWNIFVGGGATFP
jgi:hypothetical protein